jgi:hypothetical protein
MGTELEQIHEMMRTDRTSYFRNEEMQARYQELLAEGPDVVASPDFEGPLPLPVEQSSAGLRAAGPELAKLVGEWEDAHSLPGFIRNVQNAVLSIVSEFPNREQRAFMARFDRLPEKAIAAVYRELSLGKPNYIPEASEAAVANFATSPEGAELVREWGYGAARRVGVIKTRYARALADMGSAAPAFRAWFNDLDYAEAKAILRELGR